VRDRDNISRGGIEKRDGGEGYGWVMEVRDGGEGWR
jgi:hypothetical protein